MLTGEKRATTSLLKLYELEQEPLPCAGDYSVILDSAQRPRCITRITKVTQVRFVILPKNMRAGRAKEINPLAHWKKAHREAFSGSAGKSAELNLPKTLICVCEEFEVVYRGESENKQ